LRLHIREILSLNFFEICWCEAKSVAIKVEVMRRRNRSQKHQTASPPPLQSGCATQLVAIEVKTIAICQGNVRRSGAQQSQTGDTKCKYCALSRMRTNPIEDARGAADASRDHGISAASHVSGVQATERTLALASLPTTQNGAALPHTNETLRPQCARLLAPTCPPSCSISGSRELPQPLPHTQPNELSVTTPSHSMFNAQTCGLARHQIVDWRPRDADDQL
jgi:hypothetical protein